MHNAPFYVYLAGPVSSNTPLQATYWRESAAGMLAPHGITAVSPLREKASLFTEGQQIGVDYRQYGESPDAKASSIFMRDHFDVIHADVVLANLTWLDNAHMASTVPEHEGQKEVFAVADVPIPSVGTDFELAWAWQAHIPIILVAPPQNYYRKHPFTVSVASVVFDELAPACQWIVRNFAPYRPSTVSIIKERLERQEKKGGFNR